jgi:GT2 family glycosyltransferase
MLEAILLPEGYFDRTHFMYFEDMDLGWRARLAGWTALYVPESRVLHQWHGSSDRHGKAWLVVLASTNRIRTLIKNASIPFIIGTSPRTVKELAELVWYGRTRAVRALAVAVRDSVALRQSVTKIATVNRRSVERAWRAAPA